jgi:serine/threonine-protein kinase HipA
VRNGDAHLKNFGVVYAAPGLPVACAPAYDIVTTQVYLPRDVMALTLDGRKSWPSAKVLLQFAERHCGLGRAHARQILAEVADAVADVGARMLVEAKLRDGFAPIAKAMRHIWDQGAKRSLVE